MSGALEALRRALAALGALERALVTMLVLFIVASIGAQVFSRYVLDEPLIWVEEAATYAFIWATFLGVGWGVKRERHVRIATFVGRLGPWGAASVRAFSNLCILILAATLVHQAWKIAGVESMRSTIALPVRLPASLFLSVPLLVGMASVSFSILYLTAEEFFAVAQGRKRKPILPPEND